MRKPVTLALLSLAFVLAGCGSDASSDPADATPIPNVEAVEARHGAIPLRERVSGTVRSENQVAIRAEVEAPVVEVLVRSGDTVRAGQPLVRQDDTELRQQLRQAEASVQLAEASAAEQAARVSELESQAKRARSLADEGLVSPADLESLNSQLTAARASSRQAGARIEQARATAAERRSALGRTIVRAPVSGQVGQRNAEVGMLVRSDSLLFLIGDPGELIVEVPLTQEMLAHVSEGDPVIVSTPGTTSANVTAAVSRISPFLESGSFSTVAEIDVKDAGASLRPGMFVTVDILYGRTDEATLVPSSALWEDPASGALKIFVVGAPAGEQPDAPASVSSRGVRKIAEGAGVAGVEGVEPGEWVVVTGQHLLARDEATAARVRRSAWERVVSLQQLQREDLLAQFLERQQRVARATGAEPPSGEEYLRGGEVR